MPTLYVPIGVPGSGKSTWISAYLTNPHIFSPDRFLEDKYGYIWTEATAAEAWAATFRAFGRVISLRLLEEASGVKLKDEFVWDAMNLTPRDRNSFTQIARGAGWKVVGVYFSVPLEVCKERNSTRPRHRKVPDEKMDLFYMALTPPQEGEFDDVIEVKLEG